jgi:NADH:ubiquinone oxidoreductase subunit 2 (subunit N)
MAIFQDKLKKIFILNSIYGTGLHLFFICINNIEIIQGFLFYFFFYFIILLIFFFIKISLLEINSSQLILNSFILNKLYYSNFFLSLILLILIFSSLGIPPFASFFCKLFIFYSSFIAFDYLDFIFIILCTLTSCVYHLRFIKNLFFDLYFGKIFFLSPILWPFSYVICLFTFILLFFFLNSTPLFFFLNTLLILIF